MIDIHSHIIFGVDDGPKTIEESLELIGEASRQGVRIIVATSHRRKGMFETPEKVILANFNYLKSVAQSLYPDVRLCYGGELYYSGDLIEKLENKKVPTINGSRYILLEFSMNTSWHEIQKAVNEVILLGLVPLLAHIERYDALAFQTERVEELIEKGCYTQVNSAHVLPVESMNEQTKTFKKRVQYFLKHDLVHCIASDMHNMTIRPPFMKEAYKTVAEQFGVKKAKSLLKKHPLAIVSNMMI